MNFQILVHLRIMDIRKHFIARIRFFFKLINLKYYIKGTANIQKKQLNCTQLPLDLLQSKWYYMYSLPLQFNQQFHAYVTCRSNTVQLNLIMQAYSVRIRYIACMGYTHIQYSELATKAQLYLMNSKVHKKCCIRYHLV